jgi:hypothetical protein
MCKTHCKVPISVQIISCFRLTHVQSCWKPIFRLDCNAGTSDIRVPRRLGSVFTSVQDLAIHGYTGQPTTCCSETGVIERLAPVLDALGMISKLACNGGDNFMVEHKHTESRNIGGIEYPVGRVLLTTTTDN